MNEKSNWNEKDAALSDKTAIKEYGITREQILQAIRDGDLQYRENHIHGNPYLRLLRAEIEMLVIKLHGKSEFEKRKLLADLKSVKSDIRKLKKKLNRLEKRQAEIEHLLED